MPRRTTTQKNPVPPRDATDQPLQAQISRELTELHNEGARRDLVGERIPTTLRNFPAYRSSVLRHPTKNPKLVDPETIELHSPAFGQRDVAAIESDLTVGHAGEPLGERITVSGRLLDSWGHALSNQLIEIWQANSAGRYIHQRDQHPAPLDPNFIGAGRAVTNDQGEYRFTTIKPGAYPWKNHANAWRPAHIHFSVFGNSFTQRLITQLYFPGDPLHALDPIYNTIWRPRDRESLIAVFDHDQAEPEKSLAFRFDIVVDGPDSTWFEQGAS
ncbi:MAG TPA: protocatechuate 3,4-dioxygenase subunit beta [Terrimesophilobacter sp.]|nr:protocatechuate 3,4-dioxygenase subunit beta [Terrimesophilobacter sp.]